MPSSLGISTEKLESKILPRENKILEGRGKRVATTGTSSINPTALCHQSLRKIIDLVLSDICISTVFLNRPIN